MPVAEIDEKTLNNLHTTGRCGIASAMFFDPGAWPPPPGGFEPPPREPRLNSAQERTLLRLIGLLLLALFVGPLAGASLIDVAVAVVRAIIATT